MVIYVCNNCNKSFTNKTSYTRHINRKFICKKYILDISNDKKYLCLYCNKEYNHKQSKYRHQIICANKVKNSSNLILDNNVLESFNTMRITYESMIKENQELKNMIMKLNDKINKRSQKNIINNTHITTNNIIIQYGLEYRTEGLTNDEIIRIVNRGCNAIYESIKLTHFNSRLPQFHNIYIPDKKFKTIMIFKNKSFELDKIDNILYDLIDKHIDNIRQYLDMNLNFQESKVNAVMQLLEKINEVYDDENFNKFKNDDKISEILLFLYNNREVVIKNYENYLKQKINYN